MSHPHNAVRIALALVTVFLLQAFTPVMASSRRRAVRKPVIVVANTHRSKKKVRAVSRSGLIDFNVTPRSTEVWVDGVFRGTADALDGFPDKLSLKAGKHQLKLVSPTGTIIKRKIKVTAGQELNIGLALD